MIQDLFHDVSLALQSHAQTLGRFDTINGVEPKGAPGNGLHAAVWVDSFTPGDAPHGLATSSMVLTMAFRAYSDMFYEPAGEIDPRLMEAIGEFITRVSADFTLDGMTSVQAVDLLGAYSGGLGGRAGYVEISGKMFRIFTVEVPIILIDVFTQAA